MKCVLNLDLKRFCLSIKPHHLESLEKTFPQIEFHNVEANDPRLEPLMHEAEIWVTYPFKLDRYNEIFRNARNLRWLQFSYVGVAEAYLKLPREKQCIVTNARMVSSEALVLHALSFILMFERNLHKAFKLQQENRWDQAYFSRQPYGLDGLRGKVIGIVGLGGIGGGLAEQASALGMRVWGIKKDLTQKPKMVERVFPLASLCELLHEADYVVLALPLLSETKELIGAQELRSMKQSAVLINVARGGLVDEKALVQALNEGEIAGAALDVVAEEPLQAESPLFQTPNLILTPHIAGMDRHFTDKLLDLFKENLSRYCQGMPLKNVVNLETGY